MSSAPHLEGGVTCLLLARPARFPGRNQERSRGATRTTQAISVHERRTAAAFVALFTAWPSILAFYQGFFRQRMNIAKFREPVWIGLQNYVELFTDDRFLRVLSNTFYFGSAFGTFLIRQAFLEIPRIDGCSWWQLLWHVYLPSSIPVLVAFGLSSVSWHWNEFLWPLIITNSDKSRPLTAGLVRFTQLGEIGAQWSLLTAPLLIAFLFFQRRFIQSFLHSGIK